MTGTRDEGGTDGVSLDALLQAQGGAALTTDDVIVLCVPLLVEVARLHAADRVAAIDASSVIVGESGALQLRQSLGQSPRLDIDAIQRVQPAATSALNIIGELRQGVGAAGATVTDAAVQPDPSLPITRPVYLPRLGSWEIRLGHHDALADVFVLGMILAHLACGLALDDADDLARFAGSRRDLFRINPQLNPVVASVIVDMTALDRHARASDLAALARRLDTWREQPAVLDIGRALAGASGVAPRRAAVLSHLRDRLFDLSRRNRLLYFKPGASTVNLTVASVPLMLQVESIRSEQLCTWGGPFASEAMAGRLIDLHRWLRFDDQPYLPAALDRLIQEARRDRAEYGFSQLRLVVAMLRWHNIKDAPEERITSPLLWLPVELTRRKGVRDQYLLQCTDGEAEFNPVLRHQLRQLYDIRLPATIDLQATPIAEVHADILRQIRASEPSVELRLIQKPAIRLVRQKALQRMQQFQRRRATARGAQGAGTGLPDYSYDRDDYRPLGQALYERHVRPSPFPQRFEAGAAPEAGPRHARMVAASDASDDGVERAGYVLEEGDGHRYAWDLDLTQVTLANFNYRKMSLVRDYAQLLDEPFANPAFDRVFSIEPRGVDTDVPAAIPVREQWNVVPFDATQNAAIALARTGRSFIIQGPPGTGKSQTITNLIADYAGRGLRVLFVCEKRAALDVVFHRLKQSGLDPLCCLIHDSQTDKKAFVADLRACYEGWIAQPDGSAQLDGQRGAVLDALERQQARIARFEAAMAILPAELGMHLRQLVRHIQALPAPPTGLGPGEREQLPSLAIWQAQAALTQRVHRHVVDRFGAQSLAAHAFARLSPRLLDHAASFARIAQWVDEGERLLGEIDASLDDDARLIDSGMTADAAVALATASQWLLDERLAGQLSLLDATSPAAIDLQRALAAVHEASAALDAASTATANWRDRLAPDDTVAAIALAQSLEASPLRWLRPAWWTLRGELRRRYDFSRHAVHPGYGRVLAALHAEHLARATLATADEAIVRGHGVESTARLVAAIDALRRRSATPGVYRQLVELLRSAADPVASASAEAASLPLLEAFARHVAHGLSLPGGATLGDLGETLRDLRESLDDLPDLLPALRAVHAADPAYARALTTLPYPPEQIDALVADEAMQRLERASPEIARFDGRALARASRALGAAEEQLLDQNAAVIRALRQRVFADNVRRSSLSATQLDADGKAFKKRYATGRRELEHEFGKSMRYRSIRDLSDDETGLVINDLKPIWLMSPLSVSDTLPLASDLFDVVIFDEASQIPTEEAVPALSRATQVVVVGDEMQLPPTSFFSATGSGDDDGLIVEEEGERIAISLDADSLLNQAARNLPATLLAWHYRSRHESLISFSNAAFYDGRLVTIPDRMLDRPDAATPGLRSDAPQAAIDGADALMARPLSFHRVEDGVYADRCNAPEARYIAALVRELLGRDTGLSIGIVAFSEAQQGEIETALDALAGNDADFGARLEREYVREDDDQFNGLFVKNLENVQGDERDVIILSICYAPGADGRMLMNFGPINQRGGEKRLNVIFSRSRHRMAVVSSIQADAITNVHNDGAAALRAFLQFAQASARGELQRSQAVLSALNPGAKDAFDAIAPPDAVRDAVAAALRQRGHVVHEHVGRSQFRCDLAIVAADGESYALAILLDRPDAAVDDVRERYVFRPTILRRFDWRVIDVQGRDWIRDPARVIARIEAALSGSSDPDDQDAFDEDAEPAQMQHADQAIAVPTAPTLPQPDALAAAQGGAAPVVRSFRLEQNASRKFWRIERNGTDVRVVYGRIGTQGQSNLKAFDSVERAMREVDKLAGEKLRKGYVEE